MRTSLWPALALAVLVSGVEAASADPFMAFTTDTTSSGTSSSIHVTRGYSFSPTEDITILQLGIFDSLGDGLADPHQVGLWSNSGNLLASATVPAGASATLMSAYRFVSITPLALTQGETYVLGAEVGPIGVNPTDDSTLLAPNAVNGAFDSHIGSIVARGTSGAMGFAFPDASGSLVSVDPNFVAVPEPGTGALLGGALAVLGAAYRGSRGLRGTPRSVTQST